ncbi:YoaK family protein [Neofamilia massiliensis]|uniref:YoaK family protein n=1 Tax=Neofamilia massiliensis TaxID=1673724 RepID=UPI0006BB5C41|nr:YoaK family protein [Neofamilia massiliensis]
MNFIERKKFIVLINKKMEKQKDILFHMLSMSIGGFINAYTFYTRNGFMANNQTSNITKVGIYLSLENFQDMINALLPMLSFLIGSILASLIKIKINDEKEWINFIIIFEIVIFTLIGLVPIETTYILNEISKLTCSFISAFHLTAFRNLRDLTINSTICTGNIRTLGDLIANAIKYKTLNHLKIVFLYFIVLFFFPLGAFIAIKISGVIFEKSIWACSVICFIKLYLKNKEV